MIDRGIPSKQGMRRRIEVEVKTGDRAISHIENSLPGNRNIAFDSLLDIEDLGVSLDLKLDDAVQP